MKGGWIFKVWVGLGKRKFYNDKSLNCFMKKKVVKRRVKKVVRRRMKQRVYVKWMLIGLLMMLPSLFWSGAVKGLIWYHVFGALALVGLIMAVYNFIKLLAKRKIVLN